jgi:hypothetical protein
MIQCTPVTAEWSQHAGREHRRQWRYQAGLPSVQQMGGAARAGTKIARPAGLHTAADVLDQCRQHVVQQVPARDTQAEDRNWTTLAGRVQSARTILQPTRVR